MLLPRHRRALLAAIAITATSPLTITSAVPASASTSAAARPMPSAAKATTSFELGSVSCPLATMCMAVGGQFTGTGLLHGLTELWNGKHWRVLSTPSVRGAAEVDLNAVACRSAVDCLAVGDWVTRVKQRFTDHGLVAQWNGTRWRVLHLAIPLGDDLVRVSCVSGACMITGSTFTRSGQTLPIALQLRGNRVRVLKPKLPAGKGGAYLIGVSCTRPSACVAVGAGPGSGGSGPEGNSATDLVETWNGVSWRVAKTPHPKGDSVLSGISCPDSTECLATGWPAAGFGKPLTLTLLERHGRWFRLTPTGGKPTGKFATPPLNAVSCPTSSDCVAVGAAGSQGSEVWTGAKPRWVATPAPLGLLTGVSCVSRLRCIAVGANSPGSGRAEVVTAALWNGKTWKPLPISGK